MEAYQFDKVNLVKDFKWLNEPATWTVESDGLRVKTKNNTDFWQGTWYNFHFNTGHLYGVDLRDDFNFVACIEADFTTLYDQAGLMIYLDEKHWLKTGIEYNDGQPMIGSVYTNENSDWATGVYNGDPRKFWMRLTKKRDVVCVKYSIDNISWTLLRLCQFPEAKSYFVGLMCCSPQREGLEVKFNEVSITVPQDDILHSN
ncbi:uncharacterized protein LOC128200015 [Galleria mellonella]|uniref:Uncharacterized protein LOC128200015 n=1 Tax=Galleria mellonella TaxID=7137 RepID=A0ABM3M8R7_GALME|nr:uncharacterized protein LOC128200015 [Galleria mellonella]